MAAAAPRQLRCFLFYLGIFFLFFLWHLQVLQCHLFWVAAVALLFLFAAFCRAVLIFFVY